MLTHLKTYSFRPKLGRSCRCMKIQGHGYESVVECVSFLNSVINTFLKFFPLSCHFLFLIHGTILNNWGPRGDLVGLYRTMDNHT